MIKEHKTPTINTTMSKSKKNLRIGDVNYLVEADWSDGSSTILVNGERTPYDVSDFGSPEDMAHPNSIMIRWLDPYAIYDIKEGTISSEVVDVLTEEGGQD